MNTRPYDTRRWRSFRAAFLARHPLCVHCEQRGVVRAARHADHMVPIADGGAVFDEQNLQALCASCHSRKTRKDAGKQVREGCDVNGNPVGADHHWNADRKADPSKGVQSLGENCCSSYGPLHAKNCEIELRGVSGNEG